MIHISEDEFRLITDFIKEHSGIHLKDEKKTLLVGRLGSIVRDHNLNSFMAYYQLLKNDKEGKELSRLIDKITYDSLWTRKADYLFPDSEGNAPTPASVNELFIKTMTHAGIDYLARKLTPNSFRRTFNFWYA